MTDGKKPVLKSQEMIWQRSPIITGEKVNRNEHDNDGENQFSGCGGCIRKKILSWQEDILNPTSQHINQVPV